MLSCEFYPPRDDAGQERLRVARQQLDKLNCDYYSVTYGAGGSTRDRTMKVVEEIISEGQTPVMPHLTCVACTRAQVKELYEYYQTMGVRHVLALRGDLPQAHHESGDIQDTVELIEWIRSLAGDEWKVAVAAYPEMHPKARSFGEDVAYLKAKADAGANYAISQYFFNPDAYLYLRDDLAALGCDLPIYPGIMPISNYLQLTRFSDACGAELPRWLRKRLEMYQDDRAALLRFGQEVVTRFCRRLLDEGAPGLHFYSLNSAEHVLAIVEHLGLR